MQAMWLFNGDWPPAEVLPSTDTQASHIYVIEFERRTKIGISAVVSARLNTLIWEHQKLASESPRRVAISLPHPWAAKIESAVLARIAHARLKGEYTTEAFSLVCQYVAEEWAKEAKQNAASALLFHAARRLPEEPRLYYGKSLKPPMWFVAWTTDERQRAGRRRKRSRKYFSDEVEARDYLRVAIDLFRVGLLKKQEDAVSALRILGNAPVTLSELARQYMGRQ